MAKKQLTLESILSFSNALDNHILCSDCFFDAELLNLMEAHLGYTSCSFVYYELNRKYKGSVGHNIPLGKDYETSYMPIDPFAKYISENFDKLVSQNNLVVKASSVFPNYESCDYHQTLSTFSEADYAAVMLFDNLRITVFKSALDGDFTDEELDLLNLLDRMIESRYALFAKITRPSLTRTLEEMKSLYLDTLSTGVVILDERFGVIDSNKTGLEYVSDLAQSLSPSAYFSNLIPLLNFTPAEGDSQYVDRVAKFDDYVISIRLYSDNNADDSSQNERIYFITITNGDDKDIEVAASVDEKNQEFCNTYNLSPRELDIILALSNGQKYQDIADSLFISINTVRTHVKNIYRKLDIDNQRSLLYLYNQYIFS